MSRQFNASPFQSRRGSALVATLIYATLAVAVVGTIIGMSLSGLRLAQSGYNDIVVFNIAEMGAEEAILSMNSGDWSGWTSLNSGSDKHLAATEITMPSGEKITYEVIVQNADTSNPSVYVQSYTHTVKGKKSARQIRVDYSATTRVPGGLITKGMIDMSGQPEFFSFDSSQGAADPNNKGDNVTIATTSTSSDSFKMSGQVDIYGYAGTGKKKIQISGSQNYIRGSDTPFGVKVDSNRVSTDFSYSFPAVVEPSWSGSKGKLPKIKKKVMTVGTAGTTTLYKVDKLDLSGQNKVLIQGDVKMYLKDGMSISGDAYIEVPNGSTLEVYSPKDFTISGQGIVNKSNVPSNAKFFGTVKKLGDQSLSLSGQGTIAGVFYLPNGIAKISGQGNLAGSLVAGEFQGSGQGWFAYDEQLSGGGSGASIVSNWYELVKPAHKLDFVSYVKNAN